MPILFFKLVLAIIISVAPVAAEQKPERDPGEMYGEMGEKGYYNYEILPEEPEEEPEQEPPPIEPAPAAPPQEYTYEDLWQMHPDKFHAHMKEVTKYAVQYQTEQNVERFLMVQDVARRKSASFASVVSFVGQKNPRFSMADVYPTNTPGKMAVVQNRLQEIDRGVEAAKDEFALVMFSQEGCSFCDAQIGILRFFEDRYSWPVRKVDIHQNPSLAAQYGVEQTPALVLVEKQTYEAMPIASGVISMDELRTRIYRSVRFMRGEISQEQWSTYEYEKNSGNDPLKFIKTQASERN